MVFSFFLGVTQLSHSASRRRVFACGSMVRIDHFVCRFSVLRAEKRHTTQIESTALLKAQHANCVSPTKGKIRGLRKP
jgi:hypothetical protein